MSNLSRAAAAVLALALVPSAALAQSTGASPADPNNERNQRMAPSNAQPADPAASDNPAARIPTAPDDAAAANREEGGVTGTGPGTGETGSGTVVVPGDQ